jgi:hypothetical protein
VASVHNPEKFGFGCSWKGYSLSIFTQLKAARQQLRQAQEHLDKCQVKGASEAQIESAQMAVAAGHFISSIT